MLAWFRRRLTAAHRMGALVHRYAVGAAWFFIVISLAHLAWVVAVKWGDPHGVTTLYHSTVAGETRHAWGLLYQGAPGLVLALFQAAVVVTAAVFTLLPWRAHRRIGHVILVAWSSLWALDLMALTAFDHRLDSVIQTSFLLLLAGCTVYRAIRGWSPAPTDAAVAGEDLHCVEPALPGEITGDHITASERLRDITAEYRTALNEVTSRGRIAAKRARKQWEVIPAGILKIQPRLQRWWRNLAAGAGRMRTAVTSTLRKQGLLPWWAKEGDSTRSREA